jgi:hypothetical protein
MLQWGEYGLDGFLKFLRYFVNYRGLAVGLFESKTEVLMKELNEKCVRIKLSITIVRLMALTLDSCIQSPSVDSFATAFITEDDSAPTGPMQDQMEIDVDGSETLPLDDIDGDDINDDQDNLSSSEVDPSDNAFSNRQHLNQNSLRATSNHH